MWWIPSVGGKGGALGPDLHTLDVCPIAELLGERGYIVELRPERKTTGENCGSKQHQYGLFHFASN